MAEAPNEEPTASLRTRMRDDVSPEEEHGLVTSMTQISNGSDRPIFLIPISCPDGALPLLSLGTVKVELAKEIPAGDFIRVNHHEYKPDERNPRCRIYILFRAGDNAENVQEFLAGFHERYPNGVEVEGEALLFHYQLDIPFLHLDCNGGGQVTVEDENERGKVRQISFAGTRLSSDMKFFRNARVVHLRNRHGKYLSACGNRTVKLCERRSPSAEWFIEFILDSNSALRLKSYFGHYLAASDQRSFEGLGGHKVLHSPFPFDSSTEWVPVMEGTQVKLRTHYGTFLRSNDDHRFLLNVVTHDLPHCTTVFFDVEVVEREEEGSASNIEDVTESPPGGSSLYGGPFWRLKNFLLDNSERKDVLIRGGLGTTAFIRELCVDIREYFDTIVWISNPQRIDSELIHEEILAQLIFERGAFPKSFGRQPWILNDPELSLDQRASCLIVVDNLDDPRSKEKFEEISRKVNTYRVIFIARREMGSSSSQIDHYAREVETFELEDRSYVPWDWKSYEFEETSFPSPPEEFCQLIVKKCGRLTAAIVLELGDGRQIELEYSSEIWKARIPLGELCNELQFIQKVLEDSLRYQDIFCFLYLCLFEENHLFNREEVLDSWEAQGLVPPWRSREREFKLILRYFLQKMWISPIMRCNGPLLTFRVNPCAREIMVSLRDIFDIVANTKRQGWRQGWIQGWIRVMNALRNLAGPA